MPAWGTAGAGAGYVVRTTLGRYLEAIILDALEGPIQEIVVEGTIKGTSNVYDITVKSFRLNMLLSYSYAPSSYEVHTTDAVVDDLKGIHGPNRQKAAEDHMAHEIGHAAGQAPKLGPLYYVSVVPGTILHHSLNRLPILGSTKAGQKFFPIVSTFEKQATEIGIYIGIKQQHYKKPHGSK